MRRIPRRLLARCPVTGRWLDTGVVVRHDTFDHLDRIEESRVFCPYCAAIHSWNRQAAALEGDLPGRTGRHDEQSALGSGELSRSLVLPVPGLTLRHPLDRRGQPLSARFLALGL